MARDYYEILGVSRDADKDALKRAYRRLARQYHPDVNKAQGAEERFKELTVPMRYCRSQNYEPATTALGKQG